MRPLRLFALILALSSALNASAQYKDESSVMKIKGSKVYLGDEKQTLEQAQLLFSDVAGIDRSADYLKYRHWYKAGLGMPSVALLMSERQFMQSLPESHWH